MSAARDPLPEIALEKHYSVREVAEMWGLGENTVRRIFEDMPGVLKISHPVLVKRKRAPRTVLRIPASALEMAHRNRSGGFGPKVERRQR